MNSKGLRSLENCAALYPILYALLTLSLCNYVPLCDSFITRFLLPCLQLAFKFVPTREHFVASLDLGEHDKLDQQVYEYVAAFGPLLKEIHEFMVRISLANVAGKPAAQKDHVHRSCAAQLMHVYHGPFIPHILLFCS